jgi:hypothetical protein
MRCNLQQGPGHNDDEACQEEEVSADPAVLSEFGKDLCPSNEPASNAEEGRQRPIEPAAQSFSLIYTLTAFVLAMKAL